MSFQAMAWAIKQKVGNATGGYILLMLANYADENGECFPSQETLANDCECTRKTIFSWLKKFEDLGLVCRKERRRSDGFRTSDIIKLNLENSWVNFSRENSSCENSSHLMGNKVTAINLSDNLSDKSNTDVLPKNSRKKSQDKIFEDEFSQTFWPAYPNKVGKPDALKKFIKARQTTPLDEIMDGLERYRINRPADRQWLNPATFLNQARWADQPAITDNRNAGNHNNQQPTPAERIYIYGQQRAISQANRENGREDKPNLSMDFQEWKRLNQRREGISQIQDCRDEILDLEASK